MAILRADVKDLVFPGNLQEIMNRVLAAERMSQAQLVEARTRAQTQQIEAQAQAETRRTQAEMEAAATRIRAQAEAEAAQVRAASEANAVRVAADTARIYEEHPALVRLKELEALQNLATNAQARIYIGFDKHKDPPTGEAG